MSVVTVREIRLKADAGQLAVPAGPLPGLIEAQGFRVLPLRVEHAMAAADIGTMHADPVTSTGSAVGRTSRDLLTKKSHGKSPQAAAGSAYFF